MVKLKFDASNRDRFPIATFSILGLLYFIGLFITDFQRLQDFDLSIFGRNILENDARFAYALIPEFQWQNQVFTYYLIHFAIVHYSYLVVLMLYYVQGLEKATNKTFIVFSFFLFAIVWPIIFGPILFWLLDVFPQFDEYILRQSTFLGASVAVWGQIGLTVPLSRKRKLYWFGLFILLVVEFALKILFEQDATANVTHVVIFFCMWLISSKILQIAEHDCKLGELKAQRKTDVFIAVLISLHAVVMILYFWDKLTVL